MTQDKTTAHRLFATDTEFADLVTRLLSRVVAVANEREIDHGALCLSVVSMLMAANAPNMPKSTMLECVALMFDARIAAREAGITQRYTVPDPTGTKRD